MKKIIRVFPRKTLATPTDDDVRVGTYPNLFDNADEVHVSVTFSWDIYLAENLYNHWKYVSKTKIGGPALGDIGGEFTPGLYLKKGITITSRGCPNQCWFCDVWKKQGTIKELEIKDGWIIQDDNLLACSEQHIRSVFGMLKRQKHPIEFTGGIEAKLLKQWHVDLLSEIKLKQLFCAYDTPDDYEPLVYAGRLLKSINITKENRKARCYVLVGYPKDTFEKAEKRLVDTVKAGFFPFAMLWRHISHEYQKDWKRFQREWSNNIILGSKIKNL